ncbi:MAG: VCBS repeat-containing protein, partial [Flavobacteriales bacterium]|nr:VCBS repeat-containing protein [Flavobacteriales bacterium]
MKPFSFILLAVSLSATLHAQVDLERSTEIPVTIGEALLPNPWAGGFNSVQVSTIDVNLDGKEDLFLFDRIGNRVLIFVNVGEEPGDILYQHTYDYNAAFPPELKNWVLLRDYDCDGKKDIFSNISSGIRIYHNISTEENGLQFEQVEDLLPADYDFGDPFVAPVYSIGIDLPSIVDFDEDGDLDIFSYTELSTTVYYYKNFAAENGDCGSLEHFRCVNRCYGMFRESAESFDIMMGDEFECDFNVIDPRAESGPLRHTGGTLLSIDLDQNGIKDLMLSDISEKYMLALVMEDGANDLDSSVVAQFDFPAENASGVDVYMDVFPSGYYEDINGDGLKDLLVGTNDYTLEAVDKRSLWMYLNQGANDLPDFSFVQEDFLQNGMLDLGHGAFPIVFDYNSDGLKDLVVANGRYYTEGDELTSKLWLFLNTGTDIDPALELLNDNFLDLPSLGWEYGYPALGDLDADGDLDMMLGEQTGLLHRFENTAGAGNPCQFVLDANPVNDNNGVLIDPGQNATPQLIDLTGDGLLDLAIGEKNGNINVYENTGLPELPVWTLLEDTAGNVVASNFLGINGYSVPQFFESDEGNLELIVGSETGVLNHYTDIAGNLTGSFTPVTESFQGINEGDYAAPFVVDMNSDNLLDLFLGQIGGGV